MLLTKEEKKIVPGVMNSVLAPYTRVLPIMIDDYWTNKGTLVELLYSLLTLKST